MFKLLIVCVLYSAYLSLDVEAHGRMMDPPNRASVWRLPEGKDFPVAEFDAEWCDYDDPNDLRDNRNSSCGVCGPVYNGDPLAIVLREKKKFEVYTNLTSYERGSIMYKGDIVRTYKKGQWVTAKIKVKFLKLKIIRVNTNL